MALRITRSTTQLPGRIFFAAVLCCISGTAAGQTHSQSLYWTRYQVQIRLSPALTWTSDADNRRFFGHDIQNQLIFHSRLHYRIKSWDLAGGLTYSLAYSARPEDGHRSAVPELRPVAEASYELPVRGGMLAQRLRVDNRVFQENESESLFDESYFVMRFRYRIQFRRPLLRDHAGDPTMWLRVADEIMFNDRMNFYDQNRIYASVEQLVSRRFAVEAGYIYIHQQRLGRDEFFSRHVVRFSVIHHVNLAKRS